jgi:hypothetical protein
MELFAIVGEDGMHLNITAVRFTQTGGAASGLRGLFDKLEAYLAYGEFLLEDEEHSAIITRMVKNGEVHEVGLE